MTTTKRFGGRPKPLSRLFEGKLLILDMDGTSLDSELLVVATWLKVFARLDPKRKLTLRELEAFSGPPLLDSCRKCFPDRDPLEVEKLYIEEADPLYPTLANLFPGEREALARLKENGCKLAINSNKLHAQAVMALEEQGIASLFDAVVAGGDAPMKPDPAGVNRILKELGIEKENAVYLGDSSFDALTARNAGIASFLVRFYPRSIPKELTPDRYVDSYKELPEVLRSWWKLTH